MTGVSVALAGKQDTCYNKQERYHCVSSLWLLYLGLSVHPGHLRCTID